MRQDDIAIHLKPPHPEHRQLGLRLFFEPAVEQADVATENALEQHGAVRLEVADQAHADGEHRDGREEDPGQQDHFGAPPFDELSGHRAAQKQIRKRQRLFALDAGSRQFCCLLRVGDRLESDSRHGGRSRGIQRRNI